MTDYYVYRVRTTRDHPLREVRKAWYGRTWQAEWEMCPWCPRAYTERGIHRKARRWSGRTMEHQLIVAARLKWWRAHVTRRSDPWYAALRGKSVTELIGPQS